MQVHQNLEKLPLFLNAVITIGTFDGVHRGHKQILNALKEEATRTYGESVIITFHPHPRQIVQRNTSMHLINTLAEKIELLEKEGIDHLVIVPFTERFSEQSAESYIKDFLIKHFNPKSIIIGFDHRFGKDRQGDYRLLEEKKEIFGYNLIEIPQHILDEIAISSTKIREAIFKGDISTANKLLGYDFFFEGKVIKGDQIGRTLGYPTANLEYTDGHKIHLGEGVYAVTIEVDGTFRKGMLSIGKRPTLNDTVERVEVNIFDFSEDIYDRRIRIVVRKYLRGQIRYESLEDLKTQLAKDKENSILALASYS